MGSLNGRLRKLEKQIAPSPSEPEQPRQVTTPEQAAATLAALAEAGVIDADEGGVWLVLRDERPEV